MLIRQENVDLIEYLFNVLVVQDQMTFEAGPWQAFGTELLEKVAEESINSEKPITQSRGSLQIGDVDELKKKRIGFVPDFSVGNV